jgi:hypothetical protein
MLVNKKSTVLTSSAIAPHLLQRKIIKVGDNSNAFDARSCDESLLDSADPGWKSDSGIVN